MRTRDDLYTQVWTTPMHRLGAQYGISGNGLAKICRAASAPGPFESAAAAESRSAADWIAATES